MSGLFVAAREYQDAYARYRERCLELVTNAPDSYEQALKEAKYSFVTSLRDLTIDAQLVQILKKKNLFHGAVKRLLLAEIDRRQNLSTFSKAYQAVRRFIKSCFFSLQQRMIEKATALDALSAPLEFNIDYQNMRTKQAAMEVALLQDHAQLQSNSWCPAFVRNCATRAANFAPLTAVRNYCRPTPT